jgi:hypothetical protein
VARASKPAVVPAEPQRVEYDGCYKITAVTKSGHTVKIYSRGYKLKSWLEFERSLGSTVSYQAVTEEEFEQHQWYNTPLEDEGAKPAKLKVAKSPAKKAVKKPAKTATKTVAKKPQKKAAKKS